MTLYLLFLHNFLLSSYIILHMQPMSLYLPRYLPMRILHFRVTPQLQSITYPSETLVFYAPILLISLRGINLMFAIFSLFTSMMLSLRLPRSYFLQYLYLSIYSSFHFYKCNQTWLLSFPLTQLPLVLTHNLDFSINPSRT